MKDEEVEVYHPKTRRDEPDPAGHPELTIRTNTEDPAEIALGPRLVDLEKELVKNGLTEQEAENVGTLAWLIGDRHLLRSGLPGSASHDARMTAAMNKIAKWRKKNIDALRRKLTNASAADDDTVSVSGHDPYGLTTSVDTFNAREGPFGVELSGDSLQMLFHGIQPPSRADEHSNPVGSELLCHDDGLLAFALSTSMDPVLFDLSFVADVPLRSFSFRTVSSQSKKRFPFTQCPIPRLSAPLFQKTWGDTNISVSGAILTEAFLNELLASREVSRLVFKDCMRAARMTIANMPDLKHLELRRVWHILAKRPRSQIVVDMHGMKQLEYFHVDMSQRLVCHTYTRSVEPSANVPMLDVTYDTLSDICVKNNADIELDTLYITCNAQDLVQLMRYTPAHSKDDAREVVDPVHPLLRFKSVRCLKLEVFMQEAYPNQQYVYSPRDFNLSPMDLEACSNIVAQIRQGLQSMTAAVRCIPIISEDTCLYMSELAAFASIIAKMDVKILSLNAGAAISLRLQNYAGGMVKQMIPSGMMLKIPVSDSSHDDDASSELSDDEAASSSSASSGSILSNASVRLSTAQALINSSVMETTVDTSKLKTTERRASHKGFMSALEGVALHEVTEKMFRAKEAEAEATGKKTPTEIVRRGNMYRPAVVMEITPEITANTIPFPDPNYGFLHMMRAKQSARDVDEAKKAKREEEERKRIDIGEEQLIESIEKAEAAKKKKKKKKEAKKVEANASPKIPVTRRTATVCNITTHDFHLRVADFVKTRAEPTKAQPWRRQWHETYLIYQGLTSSISMPFSYDEIQSMKDAAELLTETQAANMEFYPPLLPNSDIQNDWSGYIPNACVIQ